MVSNSWRNVGTLNPDSLLLLLFVELIQWLVPAALVDGEQRFRNLIVVPGESGMLDEVVSVCPISSKGPAK